jgi:aryl-alcohol dehydrogenase-like predicted oxidoreductase
VEATWNLHERAVEPALRAAKAAGLRVMIKEALANGRLADRAAPPRLRDVAAQLGVGPDAVALATALAQPFVDLVLSGAVTVQQLEANVRAREVDGLAAFVELTSLLETPEHYWSERSRLPWN